MKNDYTKNFCIDRNKFCLGKNGGYIPCCLGDRSISVGKQSEGTSEGWEKNFDFTSLNQCILKLS